MHVHREHKGRHGFAKIKRYIIRRWPHTKEAAELWVERYWLIKHKLTLIDGIAMESKHIIIPYPLQKQIFEQLHSNPMSIEYTCLLARESAYWIKLNADIEQTVKQCSTCPEYQCTQPHKAALH